MRETTGKIFNYNKIFVKMYFIYYHILFCSLEEEKIKDVVVAIFFLHSLFLGRKMVYVVVFIYYFL